MAAVNRRGRTVAISTAAVGVVLLVAAGYDAKDWIWEEWYIHNLESTEETVRLRAVDALADMKSVRAVPHLIRLLANEKRECVYYWATEDSQFVGGPVGVMFPQMKLTQGVAMTPVAYALYRIGRDALPKLFETVRLEDQRRFKEDAGTMRPGDEFPEIIPEIWRAIDAQDLIIRREVYGSVVHSRSKGLTRS